MGTVQAKSFERQEAKEMQVPLDQIEARVDTVFIDGVCRTKDDILKKAVNELFNARDFQEVILKTRYVRKQLETLGAFKQIAVTIDTSSGPEASPSGLEVTFKVQEVRRLVGGINTLVGNNEGSMVVGLKFPNTWGRGEFVQTEYHYGTKHSSGFNITVSKPFLGWLNPRITGAVFQQAADFPWSGFRQLDRGLLTEFMFESTPGVHHSLRWEALWRELSALGATIPFIVREEMGHSLKSSIKHIVTVDRRDNSILPTEGSYFRLHQEFAGLGGDVGFVKHEAEYQLNVPLTRDVVLQGCCLAGYMMGFGHNKTFSICDRFFLGGPLGLRGFQQRGVGPHVEGHSLGGEAYWASGLHLYTPLPFRPGEGGIGDYFRTHVFATAGNVDDFKFTNDMQQNFELATRNMRWSVGAGIVLSLGHIARFELNYCLPMKAKAGDRTATLAADCTHLLASRGPRLGPILMCRRHLWLFCSVTPTYCEEATLAANYCCAYYARATCQQVKSRPAVWYRSFLFVALPASLSHIFLFVFDRFLLLKDKQRAYGCSLLETAEHAENLHMLLGP